MQTDKHKTTVLFYNELGGVFAVFPNDKQFNGYRTDLVTCYAHIGQHSTCALEYFEGLRPATSKEYNDLKTELESLGYNLEIH